MVASPHLFIDCGAAIGLPSSKTDRPVLINRSRPAMGTLFEVCLIGGEEEQLSAVAETCLSEVQRIDRRLSRFHSHSEVARINREAGRGAVIVDYELAELLTLCHTAGQQTEGWFDIAASQPWAIRNRRVEFLEVATQLDFSAIAPGYALDRAAELLEEFCVADGIIHAGTNTAAARGNSLAGRGWQVRVRNPSSDAQGAELLLELCDEFLSVKFQDSSHESFLPAPTGHAAVVVVARSGFDAEVLSTAFLRMGRARTLDFLQQHPYRNLEVAWLDNVTFPHEGTWQWLTAGRVSQPVR